MKSLHTLSSFLVPALLGACFSTGIAGSKDSKGRLNSWDNLKSLAPGQEIRVEMNNGTSYQGELESFNDNGIALRQSAGEQKLPRTGVIRISLKGQSHRLRNAVSGAVFGSLVGLAGGLEADHIVNNNANCTEGPAFSCGGPPNPHWALIGTPVVAGVFTAIGAALPTGGWHDIYRSPGWRHLIYRGQ